VLSDADPVAQWLQKWQYVIENADADFQILLPDGTNTILASFILGVLEYIEEEEKEDRSLCIKCYSILEPDVKECAACHQPIRQWVFNLNTELGRILQEITVRGLALLKIVDDDQAIERERKDDTKLLHDTKLKYVETSQVLSIYQTLFSVHHVNTNQDVFKTLSIEMARNNLQACQLYSFLIANYPLVKQMKNDIWPRSMSKYAVKYYRRPDNNRPVRWFWHQSRETGLVSVRQRVERQA
jgi:hypothetical protein